MEWGGAAEGQPVLPRSGAGTGFLQNQAALRRRGIWRWTESCLTRGKRANFLMRKKKNCQRDTPCEELEQGPRFMEPLVPCKLTVRSNRRVRAPPAGRARCGPSWVALGNCGALCKVRDGRAEKTKAQSKPWLWPPCSHLCRSPHCPGGGPRRKQKPEGV